LPGFVKNKYWVSKHVGWIEDSRRGNTVCECGKSAGRMTERGGREKIGHGKKEKKGEGKRMEGIMGIKVGVLGASV
jgi:hypothetical protein